ncbi:hypothetical protein [Hydrogenimonas urashimensis]|uniref:hypothetical protein n=1 Tax=Hydrogenimonas urashimensis TaxID=2740515 RepID=UPI0019158EA0|nr:hypothetical protein [Hydrogenimonas urashimensis]
MNFSDWLLSTIGTGAILSGVGWILRDWITSRLKKAIEHDYNKKLEKYKSDLKSETDKQLLILQSKANVEFEKFRVRIGRYTEKQFERYNELWVKLTELRHTMDDLWESANERTLNRFSRDLNNTFRILEKSALLIEPNHYSELIEALNVFAKYQIGKKTLIELRKHTGNQYVSNIKERIQELIMTNGHHRNRLNQAMQNLMDDMRRQINGTNE